MHRKLNLATKIKETWVQKPGSDGRPTAHWLKEIHAVM